jgi:hypothetical protein
MSRIIYFDTSALAKWYINEAKSEDVINLLSALSDIPLRTLDALHLAITKDLPADILATADHIMASGAKAMGISVVSF